MVSDKGTVEGMQTHSRLSNNNQNYKKCVRSTRMPRQAQVPCTGRQAQVHGTPVNWLPLRTDTTKTVCSAKAGHKNRRGSHWENTVKGLIANVGRRRSLKMPIKDAYRRCSLIIPYYRRLLKAPVEGAHLRCPLEVTLGSAHWRYQWSLETDSFFFFATTLSSYQDFRDFSPNDSIEWLPL